MYWRMRLDKDSQHLCGIMTHRGVYVWTRCPMGLKNSGGWCDKQMHTLFRHQEGIISWVDDVLVYAPTMELLVKRIEIFLAILTSCATAVLLLLHHLNCWVPQQSSSLAIDDMARPPWLRCPNIIWLLAACALCPTQFAPSLDATRTQRRRSWA